MSFNFGTATGGAVGQTGSASGLSFGSTTTANKPLGMGTTTAASGFSLGGITSTTSSGGVTFGGSTPASGGFLSGGLGGTAQTTCAPNVGVAAAFPAAAAKTSASTVSFNLGGTPTTKPTGLTLGASTTATTGGFNLGGALAAKPTATAAPTLGAASASGGFGFGGGLGTSTAAVKPTLSLGSTTSTGSGGFSLGGLGGASSCSNVTSTIPTTVTSRGLGGVDPTKSSSGNGGSAGTSGKAGDSKATKEAQVPQQICQTVEDFKKYVKQQKTVRENIARLSSKNLFKVQEEVASLRQLLSLASSSLQRNAKSIENLRMQSAQELKYAEIAQRTKDTPPGLQYENTAPQIYYEHLIVDFEQRMVIYRQQIEQTETYLTSMQQGPAISPHELSMLLSRLHSSFVTLAAQLQMVHESVKKQKEHYLNYRKVFHNDTTDVFEKRKKAEGTTGSRVTVPVTIGPTPFTGMSSAAALAMAAAMNRTQQPAGAPAPALGLVQPAVGLGQPTGLGATTGGFGANTFGAAPPSMAGTGLFGGIGASKPSTGLGFGGFGTTATTSQSTGFNFGAPTATVRPLGSSLSAGSTGFGMSGGFAASTGGFGAFGSTGGFGQQQQQQQQQTGDNGQQQSVGFQLQKPPVGNKRNKKA